VSRVILKFLKAVVTITKKKLWRKLLITIVQFYILIIRVRTLDESIDDTEGGVD
jgi:hypothetical protein